MRHNDAADVPRSASSPLAQQRPGNASHDNLDQRVRRLEQLLVKSRRTSSTFPDNDLAHKEPTPPSLIDDDEYFEHDRPPQDLNGSLRIDSKGFVRFVPGSLQWQSSRLAMADGSATAPDDWYPLSNASHVSIDEIVSALPSRSDCAELVRIYFGSYASLFHVLHGPAFHQQYQRFEQSYRDMPLAWIALLCTILGTAVHALPRDSPLLDLSRKPHLLEKVEELSSRYLSLAMKCLEKDHFLWNHNVTTLQVLILLIYSINHTNGQTWTLLGLAHHLALSIGCHVDPSHFGLDVIQCEERRRCWAALKMLYTLQNTALGHVGVPHAHFPSNCRAPADIDDEHLLPGVMDDALEAPSASLRPTQMTYLLLKFRLYDICSDICESVLSKRYVDLRSIRRLDNALQGEQQARNTRFFCHERSEEPLPPHHLAHINVLRSYEHHLTLLLHQQVILRMSTHEQNGTLRWSRLRCLDAAKSVLDIHAYVQDTPQLAPFRWYNRGVGSFHAFHAAVVLVMLCQSGLEGDCQDSIGPALQNCLTRFVSMSELSPFCAKAAPLLQALVRQIESLGRRGDGGDGGDMPRLLPSGLTIALGLDDIHSPTEAMPLSTPTSVASNQARNRVVSTSGDRGDSQSEENDRNMPDWSSLLADMQPQQWLSPALFPLDHWSAMITNTI